MKLERHQSAYPSFERAPSFDESPDRGSFGFDAESQGKQESLWAIVDDRMRGRWKYAILIGLALASILGGLGYFTARPMYQGMGAIEIKPNPGVIVNTTIEREDMRENYQSLVATQIHYIKNERCLTQALQDEELAKLPFAQRANAMQVLKKGLTVKPDRDSRLVFVTFESEDPVVAQVAANAVLRAYYEIWGKNGGGQITSKLDTVADLLRTRRRSLESLRIAKRDVMSGYETTDLRSLQASNMQSIGALEGQISNGKRVIQRRAGASQPGSNDGATTVSLAQLEAFNPYLAVLRTERDAAKFAFDSIKNSRHPTSDVYKDRESKAERARQIYEAELEKTRREWEVNGGAAMLEGSQATAVTPEDLEAFEHELESLRQQQSKLTKDLAYIDNLDFQAEQAQKLVDEAQSRMNDLETERGELQNTISVAMEASRPDEPHDDARRKRAVLGLGTGLLASFGMFFLLGSIDRRAFGSSQLQKLGHKSMPTCLGVLPDLGVTLNDPDSSDVASHCVHQIRNQIEALREPSSGYVLAVTSPFQGDGKTSIVMALGWSYAAAGYKTLLVDCDMVGRSLTRQLGLIGREGLKDALIAKELNGSVAKLPVEHLCAIPVGIDNRFGPENVRRIDLQRLLDQVRSDYDIIIVDTGPMLGALESTPVTAIADGVVLSVRRGRSRSRLEDCVSRLEMVGTKCLGLILNCAVRSDCNRYVSEASLAAAEEERATRADAVEQGALPQPAPGERNALVRAVQSTTRTRTGA